jgi:pSer/pThr/pTyr-binding forkhead associated (FHA) protein
MRMNRLERFNRSFGAWYEGLFGGGDDVRPKDILRRVLAALEDHRKEGFDNRIYVPNQYVLEINVHDEEEKEYLLSFLDRDELEAAIRRYCQQNHYHIRGALDFTVREVEASEMEARRGEKVTVRCRYNTKITTPELPAGVRPAAVESRVPDNRRSIADDDRTVAGIAAYAEEDGTVPAVSATALVVYAPDRSPFRYPITRPVINIGRSTKAGNDLVIETDGQISKRHARIEREPDGRYSVYDAGSTNGIKVNGRRVESRVLNNGDEIVLGATRLTFQQASANEIEREFDAADEPDDETRTVASTSASRAAGRTQGAFGGAAAALNNGRNAGRDEQPSSGPLPPIRPLRHRVARLVLTNKGQDVDDYLLASETLIGRGVTNDIVLPDRSIGTRHVRIINDGDGYTIERLDAAAPTTLNGLVLAVNHPESLRDGDRIGLGDLVLRFESGS